MSEEPIAPVFRSDIPCKPLDNCADDDSVVQAMFVSTDKMDAVAGMSEDAKFGRINALMRDRHGTPFEHNYFRFYSEAPIFVYREWHRHRIGVSINEQSGRYDELPPMFYVPPKHRPLVQKPGTKQMAYELETGTESQYLHMRAEVELASEYAYKAYQELLSQGIVKEVARIVLTLNIYSKMMWSCNARSLMAFLSLRTRRDPFYLPYAQDNGEDLWTDNPGGAKFPSKPQWEIEVAADALEAFFAAQMPLTYRAFVENGRVGP